MMFSSKTLLLVLAAAATTTLAHEAVVSFEFSTLTDTVLPKAISDFTVSLDETTKLAYLAGGCDADQGNVYNKDIGEFICSSSSTALYSFDYQTKTFTTLTAMPTARYRHGAALTNGKLWLLGGRDVEMDGLLPTVDVYDIATDTWKSYDLPEDYQTSDNVGFTDGNVPYFAGGYNGTYSFQGTVVSLGVNDADDSLVIKDKAPLLLARGDHTATVLENKAYVTGGFGGEQGFCEPLRAVEEYDFATDTWTRIADMNQGRGDKALVALDGHVFAMGGERQIVGICEMGSAPAVGEKTLAVDDLEVYHLSEDKWETLIEDLPSHRFRFAAVGYNEIGAIYTFGGQKAFDESCECFTTTDEILVYTEKIETADDGQETTEGDGTTTDGDGTTTDGEGTAESTDDDAASGVVRVVGATLACMATALVCWL